MDIAYCCLIVKADPHPQATVFFGLGMSPHPVVPPGCKLLLLHVLAYFETVEHQIYQITFIDISVVGKHRKLVIWPIELGRSYSLDWLMIRSNQPDC
jgi:hypothetical protein